MLLSWQTLYMIHFTWLHGIWRKYLSLHLYSSINLGESSKHENQNPCILEKAADARALSSQFRPLCIPHSAYSSGNVGGISCHSLPQWPIPHLRREAVKEVIVGRSILSPTSRLKPKSSTCILIYPKPSILVRHFRDLKKWWSRKYSTDGSIRW